MFLINKVNRIQTEKRFSVKQYQGSQNNVFLNQATNTAFVYCLDQKQVRPASKYDQTKCTLIELFRYNLCPSIYSKWLSCQHGRKVRSTRDLCICFHCFFRHSFSLNFMSTWLDYNCLNSTQEQQPCQSSKFYFLS